MIVGRGEWWGKLQDIIELAGWNSDGAERTRSIICSTDFRSATSCFICRFIPSFISTLFLAGFHHCGYFYHTEIALSIYMAFISFSKLTATLA